MGTAPLRAAAVLFALFVCAWFALGIRQAIDTDRAAVIVSRTPGASRLARAGSLLHAAGELNPDREVDLLLGRLALLEHDPGRAQRILERVARREPMNIEAWQLLGEAANGDSRLLSRAILNVVRLDPLTARK